MFSGKDKHTAVSCPPLNPGHTTLQGCCAMQCPPGGAETAHCLPSVVVRRRPTVRSAWPSTSVEQRGRQQVSHSMAVNKRPTTWPATSVQQQGRQTCSAPTIRLSCPRSRRTVQHTLFRPCRSSASLNSLSPAPGQMFEAIRRGPSLHKPPATCGHCELRRVCSPSYRGSSHRARWSRTGRRAA